MKKRVLVNFANRGREDYRMGAERLLENCVSLGFDMDYLFFGPDTPKISEDILLSEETGSVLHFRNRYPTTKDFGDCPVHLKAPYGFKSYGIQEAKDMGYSQIMYMDSSVVFLKNPEPYWGLAEDIGVVLFDNPGCPESFYTSDDCLEHLGCSAEEAGKFWMVSAGLILLDFDRPITNKIFDFYFEHSRDDICLQGKSGSTRPEFIAHRHDQSILSYICYREFISKINYGAYSYFSDVINGKFSPTFCLAGMGQKFSYR